MIRAKKSRCNTKQLGAHLVERVSLDNQTPNIATVHSQRTVFMHEQRGDVFVLAHLASPRTCRCSGVGTHAPTRPPRSRTTQGTLAQLTTTNTAGWFAVPRSTTERQEPTAGPKPRRLPGTHERTSARVHTPTGTWTTRSNRAEEVTLRIDDDETLDSYPTRPPRPSAADADFAKQRAAPPARPVARLALGQAGSAARFPPPRDRAAERTRSAMPECKTR